MGNAAKLNDIGTDHDGYPPTPIIAASPTITIDGKPAARVGDPLQEHDKPKDPPHARSFAADSSSVFFDGKPAARTDDPVNCGGVLIGGGTVNIG